MKISHIICIQYNDVHITNTNESQAVYKYTYTHNMIQQWKASVFAVVFGLFECNGRQLPHIKVQNVCYQYRTNTSLKIHTTAILYFYRSIIPHILIHSIRNTNRVLYTSSQNWNYNKRKNKKNMVLCTIFFCLLRSFRSLQYIINLFCE